MYSTFFANAASTAETSVPSTILCATSDTSKRLAHQPEITRLGLDAQAELLFARGESGTQCNSVLLSVNFAQNCVSVAVSGKQSTKRTNAAPVPEN